MIITDFENKWLRPCEGTIKLEDVINLYKEIRDDAKKIGQVDVIKLIQYFPNEKLFYTLYWRVIYLIKKIQCENICPNCGKNQAHKLFMADWTLKGCEIVTLEHLEILCEHCYRERLNSSNNTNNTVSYKTPINIVNEFKEVCNILAGGTINKSCIDRLLKILSDNRTTDDFSDYVNEVYLYARMVYRGKANGDDYDAINDNTRILKGTAAEYSIKFNENYRI